MYKDKYTYDVYHTKTKQKSILTMAMKKLEQTWASLCTTLITKILTEEAQFFTFNSEQLPRRYTIEFSCTV